MVKPMVTVIIPSYNHARYLPARIESILSQTYTNYELIIIDDCSPDDSDEVIRRYAELPNITYIRNAVNSGTPFAAWEKGAFQAQGKYVWICESDDFAEKDFLSRGVAVLEADEQNVLFYCNSNVVDESGNVIGSTADYFSEVWKNDRWKEPFVADGSEEAREFQLMGQTVPNMSSALIRQGAFQQAYSKYLLRFKLTGDWLFIGYVMLHGRVVFTPEHLNNFRKHEVTSRVRVKSARSQAEFVLTKFALYQVLCSDGQNLLEVLSNDAIRFLYEDASAWQVLREMLRISFRKTCSLAVKMGVGLMTHREYLKHFLARRKIARGAD